MAFSAGDLVVADAPIARRIGCPSAWVGVGLPDGLRSGGFAAAPALRSGFPWRVPDAPIRTRRSWRQAGGGRRAVLTAHRAPAASPFPVPLSLLRPSSPSPNLGFSFWGGGWGLVGGLVSKSLSSFLVSVAFQNRETATCFWVSVAVIIK